MNPPSGLKKYLHLLCGLFKLTTVFNVSASSPTEVLTSVVLAFNVNEVSTCVLVYTSAAFALRANDVVTSVVAALSDRAVLTSELLALAVSDVSSCAFV